jgi:aminoglycoside phosphotransferase (APT) family kinase protein
VEGLNLVERFVEGNIDILNGAPAHICQGDFQSSNLIVRDGELVGIIDFNRSYFGDPIEDHSRLPWTLLTRGPHFSVGALQGYLEAGRPEDFWRRYTFYVALNFAARLPLVPRFFEGDPESWSAAAQSLIDDHDFAEGGPPQWWPESD